MSRRPAQYTQADINRVGEWAMKKGLKALIVDMPSGVKITVPLNDDFEVGGTKEDKSKLPEGFTL